MKSISSIFVGDKSKPSFLIEINYKKKLIEIYKPDKFSKNEEFYEKYSLGKLLNTIDYNEIFFVKKPVNYKNYFYVPEIILKLKNKFMFISKTIKEKEFI